MPAAVGKIEITRKTGMVLPVFLFCLHIYLQKFYKISVILDRLML